jgi:hypothetical protein
LLATVGDQQILIFSRDSFTPEHVQQRQFQRRVAIGRTKIQDIRGFIATLHSRSVAIHQREKFLCWPHHERQRVRGRAGGQTAQDFFTALPANSTPTVP